MTLKFESMMVGATVLIVFVAYLWTSIMNPPEPVEWQSGDLIIHVEKGIPILPVFAADFGATVHIGIVEVSESGVVVLEAAAEVVETPISEFIKRGRGKDYAVFRVNEFTPSQKDAVIKAARAQIGKPGDFFLEQSATAIYSSELVRMAFDAAGVSLGTTSRLGDLVKDNRQVASKFSGNWRVFKPCKQRYLDMVQCWNVVAHHEVISPDAILADPRVTKIHATKSEQSTVVAQSAPVPKLRPSGL